MTCSLGNSGINHAMGEVVPPVHRGRIASPSTRKEKTMKTILSALIALSVITGLAGSASAFDAKTFYEQIDRDRN